MSLHRVKAVLIHSIYHVRFSMEALIDMFWFSFTDIVIFGFISVFFVKQAGPDAIAYIIPGIVFWEIIRVGQYSVSISAMWEVWSRSFSSMFITPLTLEEFLAGQLLSSLFKASAAFLLTALIGYFAYHFSIMRLGIMLPIYALELLVFSWSIGMFSLGLILRFGTDIQALSWSLVFLFQPIGAFFYPVSILPSFLQKTAYVFPIAYITESMRKQLLTGSIDLNPLAIATVLNVVYFAMGYLFIREMFKKAKDFGGFARMEA